MSAVLKVVLDTSTLISAALRPGSAPEQAFRAALEHCVVLASAWTLQELVTTLERRKFDRYLDQSKRWAFVELVRQKSEMREPDPEELQAAHGVCRDAKDDPILALGLAGPADFLVSGDADLLVLHPWRGIQIVSPRDFLAVLRVGRASG